MNLIGHYEINLGDEVITGTNLITFYGESFFLNRAINEEYQPIKYIVFGDSRVNARKNDMGLGHETVRTRCSCEVDASKKQIILSCKVPPSQLDGANEIGVANDKILISHDVFEKRIDDATLTHLIDDVDVKYTFDLSTASTQKEWKKYKTFRDENNNPYVIYFCHIDDEVIGVSEEGKSGYHWCDERKDLENINTNGAFYYDYVSGALYIRTLTGVAPENLTNNLLIYTK